MVGSPGGGVRAAERDHDETHSVRNHLISPLRKE
jgi:hypothetical protein